MSGIEEIAVKEWSEALSGLTGEQIKKGLKSWSGEWPPSSQEFRMACEEEKTDKLGPGYRESRAERILESDQLKETRKILAKTGVGKMREAINKTKGD